MPMDEASMALGEKLGAQIEVNWKSTGHEQLQTDTIATQQRIMMLGQAVQNLSSAFMMLEMAQIRHEMIAEMVQNSQLRLTDAQDRYNRALRDHGPSSQQAILAQRQLEIAQNNTHRATERANMMMQRQYLEIIPMGLTMVASLTSAYSALAGSKALAQGPAGIAMFAAGAAIVGGTIAYEAYSTSQMNNSIGAPKMHAGGAVGHTGLYMLEAGETVNASRVGIPSAPTSPGGGSGGNQYNMVIQAPMGLDVRETAHTLYDYIESERRRGSSR